jgi:hypothetical protein
MTIIYLQGLLSNKGLVIYGYWRNYVMQMTEAELKVPMHFIFFQSLA